MKENNRKEGVYEYGHDYCLPDTVVLEKDMETSFYTLNYEWILGNIVTRENGATSVQVTVDSDNRYNFDDNVFLEITVEEKDKEVTLEFDLEKMAKTQNFHVNLFESDFPEVETEDIKVTCAVVIQDIKYTAEIVGTQAEFTYEERPHDVVIIVGEYKFHVHKLYLATWSKYFDTLFYGELAKKDKKEVKLEEIDSAEFEDLLCIIHPKMSQIIYDDNVLYLLKLAHQFELPSVMAMCGNHLMNFENNPGLTLMDRLKLSDQHNISQLQVACFKKIHEKTAVDFKAFLDTNREKIKELSYNTLKNLI